MGEQAVFITEDQDKRNYFILQMLNDVRAMKKMLDDGLFESGIQRVGAEQEFALVTKGWRPAPRAIEILEAVNDPHFTTELGKFNLEINLDPQEFTGNCFGKMQTQLETLMLKAKKTAAEYDTKIITTGILPTIRRSDLSMDNMTPNPRYYALSDAMAKMRGSRFEVNIFGTDELLDGDDTIMFESCNTSFQIHLQVDPDRFVPLYNWAQAITGPVLAAATNSPLLLGKSLWSETRIALFQQSADLRNSTRMARNNPARVSFGTHWLENSIIDFFRENIARYQLILGSDIKENSMSILEQGKIPKLKALNVHNGTVYVWNRPCYGISDNGKPHLRIENRVIPAGPTLVDEMANMAFWTGLMRGMPPEYEKIHKKMEFEVAKANFLKAALTGLGSQFQWKEGKMIPSDELILKEMLPIARQGLEDAKVAKNEIDKYLGIIEERVSKHKTGSRWLVKSFSRLKKSGTRDEAILAATAGMYRRQEKGKPVHTWSIATMEEGGSWMNRYERVDQLMTGDVFTVQEDDTIDLVAHIMDWRKIRHVPVENNRGELVGIITSGAIIRHFASGNAIEKGRIWIVMDLMAKSPLTVPQETPSLVAMKLMKENKIGCLPVTKDNKMVGIITEYDFLNIATHLFEELQQTLNEESESKKQSS